MPTPATLLLFAASTLAILVVPGPSVMFVVARTLEHGRAARLVSMAGVEAGALTHVAIASAGARHARGRRQLRSWRASTRCSSARAFLTSLAGTASNPSTIASWAAIFAAASVAGAGLIGFGGALAYGAVRSASSD